MNLVSIPNYDMLDVDGKNFISRIDSKADVVLLTGSIISEWHPSNAPSGKVATNQIAHLLASQYPDNKQHEAISRYISRAPFEYILDKSPHQDVIRRIMQSVYSISTPNLVHKSIANLVNRGRIHSIITPNYDLCLDTLLPDGFPLTHVVEREDYEDIKDLDHKPRIYFKIHGTAQVTKLDSMVLMLSEEGVLPEWKQDLMKDILKENILLVMGFSGLDFEISPHLLTSNIKLVVWNSYRDPKVDIEALSPNAQRIIKSANSVIVHGDLRHILAELDSPFVWYNPSSSMVDITELLSRNMSKINLLAWSASVLSSPGYAKYAKGIAEMLMNLTKDGTVERADALFILGDAQYSRGRYGKVSELVKEATQIYIQLAEYEKAIISECQGVNSLRCIGKFRDSYVRLEKAKALLSKVRDAQFEKLKVKLELQEILLLREQYTRAKLLCKLGFLWMKSKSYAYQENAKVLLKEVLEYSTRKGEWHDIQQCRMWANRLDIDFLEVYDGPLQPLEDLSGWKHLGHMVPEMMSLRGSLFDRKYDEAPLAEVKKHIKITKEIECDPEVWKLTMALWKHFGWKHQKTPFDFMISFMLCHYSRIIRFFKLMFEEYR